MNTVEYDRYRRIEKSSETKLLVTSFADSVDVQLKGHHAVHVYPSISTAAGRYSFAMSRFGVVKLLSEDGTRIDKSPLCYELDKALLDRQYLRGGKFSDAAQL